MSAPCNKKGRILTISERRLIVNFHDDIGAADGYTDEEAITMLAHQTGNPDPSDFYTKVWIMEGLYRLRGQVKFYRYEVNNYADDAFHTTYDVLSKL